MFEPKGILTETDVQKGLRLVISDGLASEAMNALAGGVFLTAVALLLGANNFQIGLLAALPTVTNFFQLISIWLVRRLKNRRLICVVCTVLARVPLIITGACIFYFKGPISLVIIFLFFFYLFGSISGLAWNAWMKDLIPQNILGIYFARRTSYMQIANASLSLILALVVDHIKLHFPEYELTAYSAMFVLAGIIGVYGASFLGRTPEPISKLSEGNIFKLLKRPLTDGNFVRLLVFNSIWIFAINMATPFFTVFMMKSMGLPLSYIIGLTILSQLSGIFTIRMWGTFADRYSNKTIIAIAAPLYIICLIAWCFVGIYSRFAPNIVLLVLIHIASGTMLAGINLCLTNIGLKLAPNEYSIIYLSVKNIITAIFSSIAPLLGGVLADFFMERKITIDGIWSGPKLHKIFHLISLREWNFLFLISAVIGLFAVQLLVNVKETGEVDKENVRRIMRSSIKSNLREYFLIGHLINWQEQLAAIIRRKKNVAARR
ncbi:MFS transporter [Danxiaibacter flavus]|uniref:MFS transporter n=1 Tax=Danxiaibacter flavus TaxID=3049108 RepID=A0ABV3ZJH7_9BACT|nr:MFS transporter [Chitinophagaceae bacterium DXS]